MADAAIGIALGILIAVVSGLALLLLLYTATRARPGLKATLTEISELLSMPTFWFGGPWVAGSLLRSVDLPRAVPFYTITLAVCFCAIAVKPLFTLIIKVSDEIAVKPRRA
jgi:hypothetical protein